MASPHDGLIREIAQLLHVLGHATTETPDEHAEVDAEHDHHGRGGSRVPAAAAAVSAADEAATKKRLRRFRNGQAAKRAERKAEQPDPPPLPSLELDAVEERLREVEAEAQAWRHKAELLAAHVESTTSSSAEPVDASSWEERLRKALLRSALLRRFRAQRQLAFRRLDRPPPGAAVAAVQRVAPRRPAPAPPPPLGAMAPMISPEAAFPQVTSPPPATNAPATDAFESSVTRRAIIHHPGDGGDVVHVIDKGGEGGGRKAETKQQNQKESDPPQQRANWRNALVKIYTVVNPARLDEVDEILEAYQNHEQELFTRLALKYGLHLRDLAPAFSSNTAPAASTNYLAQRERPAAPISPPPRRWTRRRHQQDHGDAKENDDDDEARQLHQARVRAHAAQIKVARTVLQGRLQAAAAFFAREDVRAAGVTDEASLRTQRGGQLLEAEFASIGVADASRRVAMMEEALLSSSS